MMWDDTRSFLFIIPPDFMCAAGISTENKPEFSDPFDYFSIFKPLHAATITGTENESEAF